MNTESIFVEALKRGLYLKKVWVIRAFSVYRETPDQERLGEFDIRYTADGVQVMLLTDTGLDWVTIDGRPGDRPLFYPATPLKVTPDMIPNCVSDVDSTYGDLLFNWIAVVEPFGNRIDYQVGPVNITALERKIAELLVDDRDIQPSYGSRYGDHIPPEKQITVSEYMKYGRCMGALAGFVQLFVPSITPKSMTTHPDSRRVRAELIEKYADRLWDPVIQARIQNELIKLDKEHVAGDPSEGFFLGSNKTFGTARKRMFSIHGPEAGFSEGGNAELVVNSLNEGWDLTKLVPMFNSTRAGSFYRGALTALGGEAVKFFMRVFQNIAVTIPDCGSRLGVDRYIGAGEGDYYVGLHLIKPNGTEVITRESAKKMEGTVVRTRSPLFCKEKGDGYCEKCVGEALAAIRFGLAAENTSVASKFMDIMMASAHAKELKTAKLDFARAFS